MALRKGRVLLVVVAAAGVAGAVGYLTRARHEYEHPAETVPSVWAEPLPRI